MRVPEQTVKLVEIQPANKSHVVRHDKAGMLKYPGNPELKKVCESRCGRSKEHQLRIRNLVRDLANMWVVR